ncbi:hypothetical protein [Paenibacillus thermotolerans]|uniref:hypothetical protein n=1 Tax=Paenibacillus thermotolerans TaxID=3027807 RepID=UPI0023679AB4|nr:MULTISPECIES: hypothetical protein [unclassified Paenibacillus]
MRSEGKVVLEVEKLLAYLGVDYNKWITFNNRYDSASQIETLQLSKAVLPPQTKAAN